VKREEDDKTTNGFIGYHSYEIVSGWRWIGYL